MGDPYIAEIRIFANIAVPTGWLECNGAILQIADNKALFSLIGTSYGGDGTTTFALPDMRGRVPMQSVAPTFPFASAGGEITHTLVTAEMPSHSHVVQASVSNGAQPAPVGNVFAVSLGPSLYQPPDANRVQMDPNQIGNAGSGTAHENMQPYVALLFCISTTGVFPSRN